MISTSNIYVSDNDNPEIDNKSPLLNDDNINVENIDIITFNSEQHNNQDTDQLNIQDTEESSVHMNQDTDQDQDTEESDFVNCSICMEDTTNIIIFNCKHVMCLNCLQTMYWTRGPNKNILCPFCRTEIEQKYQISSNTNNNSTHNVSEITSNRSLMYNGYCYLIIYILCFFIICVTGLSIIQSQYKSNDLLLNYTIDQSNHQYIFTEFP